MKKIIGKKEENTNNTKTSLKRRLKDHNAHLLITVNM